MFLVSRRKSRHWLTVRRRWCTRRLLSSSMLVGVWTDALMEMVRFRLDVCLLSSSVSSSSVFVAAGLVSRRVEVGWSADGDRRLLRFIKHR